jgi:hypothetical protein
MPTYVQQPTPSEGGDAVLDEALHRLHGAECDLAKELAEERARAAEGGALRKIEEAVKEVERAERHSANHWIVVNGDRRTIHGERVTFDEIVKIAYPVAPPGTDVQFTVQYTRGPETKPTGTLIEGQSVKVRNGMEFDVTSTNRS